MKKQKDKLDEIDLIRLIMTIWTKKNLIITFTFVFGIIGYLLSKQTTEKYDFSLKFKKIDYAKEIKYSELNYYKDYTIDKNYLFDLFYYQVQNSENIVNVLKNINYIKAEDYISNDNYIDALYSIANNFKFKFYNEKMEWKMTYEGNNLDIGKIEKVIKEIFTTSNIKVKNFLINDFNRAISAIKTFDNKKMNDLNLELNNIKKDFYAKKKSLIGLLKIHYQIAKNLNIDKNLNISDNFSSNKQNIDLTSDIFKVFKVTNSYYLKGYLNIDQEIKQLEILDFEDDINQDYYVKKNKKEVLYNNSNLKYTLDAFSKLDFSDQVFKSVNFDTNKIKIIKKSNNGFRIFVLFILFGLSLSSIYVLIKNNKRN